MWIGVVDNDSIYNIGDVILGGTGSTYNYLFAWEDQSLTPGGVTLAAKSGTGFLSRKLFILVVDESTTPLVTLIFVYLYGNRTLTSTAPRCAFNCQLVSHGWHKRHS